MSCLAAEQGRDVADLEAVLLRHVARRACFSDELSRLEASGVDGSAALAPSVPEPFDPEEVSQLRRYSRQLVLPQVGDEGQKRLSQARVLVVGAGALGSPVALYLAAAGVGSLTLVDPDAVDLSNLQRQILHGTADLGQPKVASAARRLSDLNPLVRVDARAERLTDENAARLVAAADVVVDGSDNPETRHALNRACVEQRKPWVHGAIWRFFGQVTVFEAGGSPCYRCLFPDAPASAERSCEVAGVMGATAGIVGSVQAQEAIRLLLGEKSPLAGVLWTYDGWTMDVERMRYAADPACPVCGV
ncbi:MAG TPA: HesA/MoeB/ThiF family protein [Stenomitos sp.]